MLKERAAARAAKDWARADALRDALHAAGIAVEDSVDGAHWHLDNAQESATGAENSATNVEESATGAEEK